MVGRFTLDVKSASSSSSVHAPHPLPMAVPACAARAALIAVLRQMSELPRPAESLADEFLKCVKAGELDFSQADGAVGQTLHALAGAGWVALRRFAFAECGQDISRVRVGWATSQLYEWTAGLMTLAQSVVNGLSLLPELAHVTLPVPVDEDLVLDVSGLKPGKVPLVVKLELDAAFDDDEADEADEAKAFRVHASVGVEVRASGTTSGVKAEFVRVNADGCPVEDARPLFGDLDVLAGSNG